MLIESFAMAAFLNTRLTVNRLYHQPQKRHIFSRQSSKGSPQLKTSLNLKLYM